MMRWPVHGMFAGILAVSIAANLHRDDATPTTDDFAATLLRRAQSHGMVLDNEVRIADVPAYSFRAPGCSQPVLIAPVDTGLNRAPLVPLFSGEDYTIRYVYLGRVWQEPNRVALFAEWKLYRALAAVGLTRYVAAPYVLLIDGPRSCEVLGSIDWAPIWDRDYLVHAGATSSTATTLD